MQTPPLIPIPANILQGVMNYLAERPWKEVNGMLTALADTIRTASEPTPPPIPPGAGSAAVE